MSNIGKKPIKIPISINILQETNNKITIESHDKTLHKSIQIPEELTTVYNSNNRELFIKNEKNKTKALWGTTRNKLQNEILGITHGFTKILKLNGIGYKATNDKNTILLNLGFSHVVKQPIEQQIQCTILKNTEITLTSHNKNKITQFAQKIRNLKKPDPYKGKGICYQHENIKLKEGKKK